MKKVDRGGIAQFERELTHSVEVVWSWLTDNEKIAKWFPELQMGELREGGFLTFDMPNGKVEKLAIKALKMYSVLEFDWWDEGIRFELYQENEGCKLMMIERMAAITNHTPKDLAGWNVCLDVIQALMDGKTIDSRNEYWKEWYGKYLRAVGAIF